MAEALENSYVCGYGVRTVACSDVETYFEGEVGGGRLQQFVSDISTEYRGQKYGGNRIVCREGVEM